MPAVSFTVDATAISAHLASIDADVEAALIEALKPLASSLAGEARSAAEAHIRFLGKKPGQYLASIYGGTFAKQGQLGRIVGMFVRSGNPLAHLLEHGTTDRYRKTFRSAREVLDELRTGYTGAMPPYPAIEPLLAAHAGEIQDTMADAIKKAVKWP